MSILIRNVELNGVTTDIGIVGNRIAAIGENLQGAFDQVLDGSSRIAVPAFYNLHTHASMTMLRGYADDMELMDWLNNHIWPAEAKMTDEDYYWGAKLACMEMLRSGTVGFCDMYFGPESIVRAVNETGMRCCLGLTVLEASPNNEAYQRANREALAKKESFGPRIKLAMAPHAIYTVSGDGLKAAWETAQENGLLTTMHLAETAFEDQQCKELHGGMSPTEYVDSLGILSDKMILAHCVHLSDHDIEILSERKSWAVFNPVSNLKLCSGLFRFRDLLDSGCNVALGTDGTASNNNLSMFDEMKTAMMVAKLAAASPLGGKADEIYRAATENGARALGLDAGVIQAGKLADIVLLDKDSVALTPGFNLVSNLVYAADTSCVETVICDGNIVMQDKVIPGQDEVLENVRRCVRKFR